jgi:putative phosphoesterase
MKIGVIACTHIPQAMPALPEKIKAVFKGVDIILHVGDVTDIATLRQLENNFTITIGVSGEQDSEEVKRLVEPKRVVEFAKRRIGMLHGDVVAPAAPTGALARLRARFGRAPEAHDFCAGLLEQFDAVDAIVFGHTHRRYAALRDGVFLFNPGAAAALGGIRPSVGILEILPRSISGRFVYL